VRERPVRRRAELRGGAAAAWCRVVMPLGGRAGAATCLHGRLSARRSVCSAVCLHGRLSVCANVKGHPGVGWPL